MLGTMLGHYEILEKIGAGGMGQVFRARDAKLSRDVAVKVLPEAFATSPDRLMRFEREVKAVAALSHPNILAIHDYGKSDETVYAVMELLTGESLQERLQGGSLPERKAIEIAARIALALGAAHDKGIVHRDVKPANVFLTGDGQVKVLDFGLAKVEDVPQRGDTTAETVGSATRPGKVMGTVGYMSPEQVRGDNVDHRTDIFSFGLVLYEMLAGKRAFDRDSAVETLTAILREDPPDLIESGYAVSPGLNRVVRRCLEKNAAERFHSARDLAFALENVAGGSTSTAAQPPIPELAAPARNRLTATLPLVGIFLVGTLLGVALRDRIFPTATTEPVRVRPLSYSGGDSQPSASPNGNLVLFRSNRDGTSRIWLKQMTGGGEAPLTSGTDTDPSFSPDGSSALFVRERDGRGGAFRVALVGGEPREVVEDVREARWSPDGKRIGFIRDFVSDGVRSSMLAVVDASGDNEVELLRSDTLLHHHLRWSPRGDRLAVVESGSRSTRPDSIRIVNASNGRSRTLAPEASVGALTGVTWNGDGHQLVFAESGSAMGDQSGAIGRVLLYNLRTEKATTLFWARHLFGFGGARGTITILAPGVVVFDALRVTQDLRVFSLRRGGTGEEIARAGGSGQDRQPAYAPGGETVIFSSNRSGNLDLWTLEVATGSVRQLTDDEASDWDPAFTPDGEHVLWSSDRSGHLEIWIADKDGGRARQLTKDGYDAENPTATRDGWVVYWSAHPEKRGVWKVRTDGTEAACVLSGGYVGTEVSPDGRYSTFLVRGADLRPIVRVVDIRSGDVVPFEIEVPWTIKSPFITYGRSRWIDAGTIAFVAEDEAGLTGIFAQDFAVGRDTSTSRRPLAGFSPEYVSESFGVSPEGTRITLAALEQSSNLMIAEGVPGVEPRGEARP